MEPVFDENGGVNILHLDMYGGLFTTDHAQWNGFEPAADGPDKAESTVRAGIPLSEEVMSCAEKGIASITEGADGYRHIVYRGKRAPVRLTLGELQRCAATVLRQHMQTSGMKKIYKTSEEI